MVLERDVLFISHANPEDNVFTTWLGAKLTAAGYEVWADILRLVGGQDWQRRLENVLRNRAFKVLLVGTQRGVDKQGVRNEIQIASNTAKQIKDNDYIIPLRLEHFDAPFLIAHAQHIDFSKGWTAGLAELMEALTTYNVPKAAKESPELWRAVQLAKGKEPVEIEEKLISNWLKFKSLPAEIHFYDFSTGVAIGYKDKVLMFLSNGEGIVFRGALGPWYHTEKKEFHLNKTSACDLISTVVKEYTASHGSPPEELFIHAQAAFSDEEWAGFNEGCPKEVNLVGIQITDAKDGLKLFRPGAYPVMRGMALKLSERQAYLWTAGYVPRLDTYIGPETPNPIFVKVQRGRCPIDQVLKDILGLNKINFNSCLLNDRMPVTIKFANAVGDVLTSAPNEGEPKLPFKYYI